MRVPIDMTTQTTAGGSTRERSSQRRGHSLVGLLLALGFYLLGVLHYYLTPVTGGLTTLYWDPVVYDLILNPFFLGLIYIPLIQLPLAAVYYVRAQDGGESAGSPFAPTIVFGLFVVIAVVHWVLLGAQAVYPWDAGSLQWLVDHLLWSEVLGPLRLSGIVNVVFLGYFPVIIILFHRIPQDQQAPTVAAATETLSTRRPTRSARGTGYIERGIGKSADVFLDRPLRIPYWVLVGGVISLIIAGLVMGGLESAIAIAGLFLSLYELQPDEPDT